MLKSSALSLPAKRASDASNASWSARLPLIRRAPPAAARLAAAQALYQIELTGVSAERALGEFLEHRVKDDEDGAAFAGADRALFAEIVRGVAAEREAVDGMVASALSEAWAPERLDRVVRAILRAGAFELLSRAKSPARVVINEYVDVAHAFFDGKEPGFVNGVLDRLARIVRPQEMEEASREPARDSG